MNARILLLLVVASTLAAPPGRGQEVPGEIRWVSANRTYAELGHSITSLYVAMCNAGILPTRNVQVDGGALPEQVLRTSKAFYGEILPVAMDELLCSLNPSVCTSRAGGTPVNCGQSRRAVSAPRPAWRYQRDATLVIPGISFAEAVPLRLYPPPEKSKPHNVEGMETVAIGRGGCDANDRAGCRARLQAANPEIWGAITAGSYHGDVLLPTLTLSAYVNLQGNRQLYDAIKSNLVSSVTSGFGIGANSRADNIGVEALDGHQRALFRRIGHPAGDGGTLDVVPGAKLGIIDGKVSPHCLLAGAVSVRTWSDGSDPMTGYSKANVADPCPSGVTTAVDPSNHGTHMLGIVGIKPDATVLRRFAPGLAIEAYPVIVERDPLDLAARQLFVPEAGNPQSGLLIRSDRPGVYNISSSYQPKAGERDPFDVELKMHAQLLFVAAAAERAAEAPSLSVSNCWFLPGCAANHRPNVMMVAAIDGGDPPAIVPMTNDGAVIDIAAPGEDIPSTIGDNQVGLWSGTSQAAPWVAATAAVIRAMDPTLQPSHVRNRLIATSDIYPHLYDQIFGGILNVGRSLAFREDVIVIRPGARYQRRGANVTVSTDRPTVLTGLIDAGMDQTRLFDLSVAIMDTEEACRPRDGRAAPDLLNLGQIHRLHLDRTTGRHYIYYEPRWPCPWPSNMRLSRLRTDGLRLRGDSRLQMMDPADSATIEVELSDIDDLYRRIKR